MKKTITTRASDATTMVEAAWQTVGESFDRFCLTAGIASLTQMMEEDSERLCGPRHGRSDQRAGHRWGRTTGRLGFHGGTIEIERPRVRRRDGGEMGLPSWEAGSGSASTTAARTCPAWVPTSECMSSRTTVRCY